MKTVTVIWLVVLTVFLGGLWVISIHHNGIIKKHQNGLTAASEVFHAQSSINKDVIAILLQHEEVLIELRNLRTSLGISTLRRN